MVKQFLALEYPNGRIHECELEVVPPLRPGSEFDAYGRRWRVQHIVPADRNHPQPWLLCTAVGQLAPAVS
jgi:hypothetical protein